MSLFLSVVPVSRAVEVAKSLAVPLHAETVPLDEARERVLAADIISDIDIPGFTRSVMDGYAVLAADTAGAGDAAPAVLSLRGRVMMGSATEHEILPGECIYLPTGGILPAGADAVVMAENTEPFGDSILVKKPAADGENIIRYNEDFKKGETVLNKGRRLSAQDLGVLAAVGCDQVPVTKRPRIGIISTGNELVPVTQVPAAGQVRDVNSFVIAAFVRDHGCIPVRYGIVRDDRETFAATVQKAAGECDAVLISGGSSKDDRDMTAAVIAGMGEVFVHGVAIAPGKPTVIGRAGTVPAIGLPGHPAATFVVLLAIARHLLDGMTGNAAPDPVTIPATLAINVPSTKGREDFLRVTLKDGVATPLFGKSGLLNTLARSNGILRVPAESEGFEKGSRVEIIPW
ncbi:gephyrin-like molybdotransferase Glp [Methanoregula sp. UBA64]|jgi:molybdopterin molybdotransferase|uniref:molybdopterin molybdotransferase MoeA n=1 Tax=Methanoregula sp. UBA64 TaxID=1915554 RepID=UPI0025FB9EE0|nr:gephyrin-like molybdotransferase Glp [Methanoregula sp. UBA64]